MQIFDWFKRRSIRSGLQRNKANITNRKPVAYDKTSSVGLLYTFKSQGELNDLISFKKKLSREKKKVQLYVYYPEKECPTSPYYKSFCKKHFNVFTLPRDKEVFALINTPFDILISFNTMYSFPLQYISTVSAANFRIGLEVDDPFELDSFDLTFNESSPNIASITNLFEKYISKINTN